MLLDKHGLDCPKYYEKLYDLLKPQVIKSGKGARLMSIFGIFGQCKVDLVKANVGYPKLLYQPVRDLRTSTTAHCGFRQRARRPSAARQWGGRVGCGMGEGVGR